MKYKYFLIPLFIAILIGYLSIMPTNNINNITLFYHQDKIIHMFMYLTLTLSILYSYYKQNILSKYYKLKSIIVASIFGLIMEISQEIFTLNREGELLDFLANLFGAILSIWVFKILINTHLIKKRTN